MQKSKWNNYSYTILLGISIVLVAAFAMMDFFQAKNAETISCFFADGSEDIGEEEAVEAEIMQESIAGTMQENSTETLQESSVEVTEGVVQEVMVSDREEEQPVIFHADVSYFDDALFIGDSRTVGLSEYGGLGNAEVFADAGMNIYKVFTEEFVLRNEKKVSLEEALQTMNFGKVYIMLGINELGYDFEQTVTRFSKTIDEILEYQPDAYVFIQANLHITKEKSEESEYFTNENIDRYNYAISQLADGKRIFYLDANELYDDEEGCLSTEFTTDHAHILGKYYVDWVDFILQNAVRK